MALEDYEGPGEVQYNNSTLAEAQSLSISGAGNNNSVVTMKKGLAGRSRGAVQFEITVENAVPKAGLEHEFVEQTVENADVTITHLMGGRTYLYDGWIESVDLSQSTDAAASISFVVMAGKPRII